MFDQLPIHQDRILATIGRTERDLCKGGPPDLMIVAKARWSLARELEAYKHYKHSVVFDPVIRSGQAEVRRQAIEMKRACLAAGEAYRSYVARWGAERFPECWELYRPAAILMMAQARAHIEAERQGLWVLIGRLSADIFARIPLMA